MGIYKARWYQSGKMVVKMMIMMIMVEHRWYIGGKILNNGGIEVVDPHTIGGIQ